MYEMPDAPLSVAGVLDQGFRLLKASFNRIIVISLVISFLGSLPNFFLQRDLAPDELGIAGIGTIIVLSILASLIPLIGYGAIIARANATARNQSMTAIDAVGVGLSCFLPLLGVSLLYTLAVAGGLILLIVPGLYLSVAMVFSTVLVVTTNMGPLEALKRSRQLVKGHWWRAAIIFTVTLFVTLAMFLLIAFVGGAAGALGTTDSTFAALNLVFTSLASAFATPIVCVFTLAALYDLELRESGDDLDERLTNLSG